MIRSLYCSLLAGLTLTIVGCGAADREELARVRAELQQTQAELAKLQAAQPIEKGPRVPGYVEELERLEALRAKGVLTKEEFEAKKRAVLERPAVEKQPVSAVQALDKQLRVLQSLYSNNTINLPERDAKKAQILRQPITLRDLQKDLETVQKLYSDNVINLPERDNLKQRLLGTGSGK
jgi:multidrug resistance efflux pump